MSRFVLVTRRPDECQELQALLRDRGIVVRPYPVLRLEEVEDRTGWRTVVEQLQALVAQRAWLVIASPRAPRRLVDQARSHDATPLLDLPVAAVGQSTAEAATAAGLQVELTGPGGGAGLARQLLPKLRPASQLLLACGHHRRAELPGALTAAGHQVLPLVLYRMRATPPRELPPLPPQLDAVVLTSPRAARHYLEGVGGLPLPCQHLAMGPTTQTAAEGLGISCRIPQQPTIQALAEELCRI